MKMNRLAVLTASILLAGCAGGNNNDITPMPVDSNPSVALQYARAMNLRLITDYDQGQYVIFNEDTGKSIRPLKAPVVVGTKGDIKTSGNGSVDVIAGFITHTAFIPALSVLTSRAPVPFSDGIARVATWQGGNAQENSLKLGKLLKEKLPLFDGFSTTSYCKDGIGYTTDVTRSVNANGTLSALDVTTLPKPPFNAAATVQIMHVSDCFNSLAQRKENKTNVIAFSEALGEQWALFVPGSTSGEPVVYRNGTAYFFKK
ncbi:TPA: hypothetical protein L9K97_005101 [Klebsiella pneumoniae]|nr:hypothetical protein [Klebsiella pneumoniae]